MYVVKPNSSHLVQQHARILLIFKLAVKTIEPDQYMKFYNEAAYLEEFKVSPEEEMQELEIFPGHAEKGYYVAIGQPYK